MPTMETAAAVILVVLTVALLFAWRAMTERPGRWDRYLSESFWRSTMRWVALLGTAAAIGSFAAGGGELAAAVLIFTLVALGSSS